MTVLTISNEKKQAIISVNMGILADIVWREFF